MTRLVTTIAPSLFVLLLALPAVDAATSRDELPAPLKPWVDWVLHGTDGQRCPASLGTDDLICTWPSRLVMAIDSRGGTFVQDWWIDAETWVKLPGDERLQPLDVKIDGVLAPVTMVDSGPGVHLTPGSHRVSGQFLWREVPESLPVPPETGLIDLTLDGKPVTTDNRDAEGRLWLQRLAPQEASEELLAIVVHRRVTDDIPTMLLTRVELRIAGRNREAVLARPIPDGFVAMALASPLPARLDRDGHLRVQLRPGVWTIEIAARSTTAVTAIVLAKPDGTWADQEVWVFEAMPGLRVVEVEGVTAIDPQQTTLPDDWRRLPTYRVGPGDTLRLTERRRGDADPTADQLNLARTWWLDFDGGGYTIQDHVGGTLRRNWRLEMGAPTALGHVVVADRDQLITQQSSDGPVGVELRHGTVDLRAESRIEGRERRLPAVGWRHDFDHVSGTLNLPPGWRLITAFGVDEVPGTWLRRWTLLDLFLVLVIALSFGRLWGRGVGVIALVGLTLSFTEVDAPHWSWLVFLATEGLLRALPGGRMQTVMRAARLAALVILLVIVADFSIGQCRAGLYPALEQPTAEAQDGLYAHMPEQVQVMAQMAEPPPAPSQESDESGYASSNAPQRGVAPTDYDMKLNAKVASNKIVVERKAFLNLSVFDPKAVVQTGPGVPTWQWTNLAMRWSGPVDSEQLLQLWLLPPWATRLLSFLRVGLLALLLWPAVTSCRQRGAGVVVVALLLSVFSPTIAVAQEVPEPSILQELKGRLLERPACHPNCASLGRLLIEATQKSLVLRLDLVATEATAVPLPGGLKHWTPRTAVVDGNPAAGLTRDASGTLWLRLPPGAHQVILAGPLPERDSVALPLPLHPARVEANATGWSIEGIDDDGLAGDSLELRRTAPAEVVNTDAGANPLPSFVRVERDLVLGLQWQVSTRVIRMTPEGSPIVIEVPLLEGESVTTSDVRVVDGKVVLSFAPQTAEVTWSSALAERPRIDLKAPRDVSWVEVWRLSASPVWHVALSGIPVIHHTDQTGARLPTWQPWPGEEAAIDVSRPAGVSGQTITIDSTNLLVTPGLRATDVNLTVVLRGSRGEQHTMTLPEGADLQQVTVNGSSEPLRLDGRRLVLPIRPGTSRFEISWREARGMGLGFRLSPVDVGLPSVSAETRLAMPGDRWLLWAVGPTLGPAVLFWGVLLVLAGLSIALGQNRRLPLRSHHWFLLSLGLTQVSVWLWVFLAGWFLVLAYRRERVEVRAWLYDLDQMAMVSWTVIAVALLIFALQQGLLGQPDMQVAGNNSTQRMLVWFADRAAGPLPRPAALSLPMWTYRVAMLVWALWLASGVIGWLRWGWDRFSEGGLWRPLELRWPRRKAPTVA